MKTTIAFLLAILLTPLKSIAVDANIDLTSLSKSAGVDVKLETVTTGLGIPWGMTFLSDTELLISERAGKLVLLDLNNKSKKYITNVPKVLASGQGGLLDVAIPPDYAQSKWIYFTYVKDTEVGGATTLARAKLENTQLIQLKDLIVTKSATSTSYHFGSRITFDNNGHVYFGIGDRGERPNGQNLLNHAGAIIRLNLDGSLPADNPFIKQKNVLPEIWSYGHRNPQGLSFDHVNNRLWEIEHGPRGGDEINLVLPGKNYGWPVISYGKEYWGPVDVGEGTHKQGMQQPVKVYVPSIAPGSLLVYNGNAYPNWKGNLFAGALKLQHINRIVLDENAKAVKEERFLEKLEQRIRSLTQSPEGLLYFATDNGNVYRLTPQNKLQ